MVATKKNKIGYGTIGNIWVDFHKFKNQVFYRFLSSDKLIPFCSFKEFSKFRSDDSKVKNFKSYPELMKVSFEYTDKFGEDANYSWVNRKTVEVLENVSDTYLIRLAKKEMGINLKHKIPEKIRDTIRLDFYNSCTVLFINFEEN